MADLAEVECIYCYSRQGWRLVRPTTGEACWLEPGDWCLHELPDGLVIRDSQSKKKSWVSDVLQDATGKDKSGSTIVYDARRDRVFPLVEYQQLHQPRDVHVRSLGSSSAHKLLVYVLDHPVDGAVAFWSLKVVYGKIIGVFNTTASRWYQNWWKWWKQHMQRIAIPASHLRRAVCLGRNKETEDLDEAQLRIFQDSYRETDPDPPTATIASTTATPHHHHHHHHHHHLPTPWPPQPPSPSAAQVGYRIGHGVYLSLTTG